MWDANRHRHCWGLNFWTSISVTVVFLVYQASAGAPTHIGMDSSCYKILPENTTHNGTVTLFSVTVTDPDGDDITVTMDPTTSHFVKLSTSHGSSPLVFNVTLNAELDFESKKYPSPITFRFTATDSPTGDVATGNVDRMSCTIYMEDVNDNPPIFQGLPYTWDIPEEPFNSSNIYSNIKASDIDTNNGFGTVTYTMKPTTQSDSRRRMYTNTFRIDQTNGHVTLLKTLDYKENNYYQFNVTATDGGGLTDHTSLIIRVLDVQNQPPFFTGNPYRKEINEEVPVGHSLNLRIQALDGDSGVSNKVTYAIIVGTCKDLFNISSEGSIVTSGRIDRDSGEIYSNFGICKLKIQAREIETPNSIQYGNTTTMTEVTIEIKDINDNTPEFGVAAVKGGVAENTPANVPINLNTSITVVDKDQPDNARISLHLEWMNGTNCTDFKPVPEDISREGEVAITVQQTKLLDYEVTKSLSFMLIAQDKANASYHDYVEITLEITDVNDNNPDFGSIKRTFSISENSKSGTVVGTVTATDKDTTSQGKLVYSISGGSDRFIVKNKTGEIKTHCPKNCSDDFDRERYSDFTISYSVKDEGNRPDFVSLTVHLNDVNDNSPTFYRREYKAYISENDDSYNTTPVVTLDASDKDETMTNNQITFLLLNIINNTAPGFISNVTLNKITGQLFLKSSVDYEKLPNSADGTIAILVQAKDNGSPARSSTATVIITVQDENDNEPIFHPTNISTAKVPENATSNTTSQTHVCYINASDSDGTERNSEFHYFIVEGAYEKFTINSTTGDVGVQINAKLDRETRPLYNISINAIDQGSPPHTSTATLYLTVTDVNDELPTFSKDSYSANIREDSKPARSVVTVAATDKDENSVLRYRIEDFAATNEFGRTVNVSLIKDYFSIHPGNGTVYVSSPLDRETIAIVTLTVQVEDIHAYLPRPQIATVEVRITLMDVNDHDPVFSNSTYSVDVYENAPSIDLQLTATDADLNRTITYTLMPGPPPINTSFAIEPKTGKLKKVGPLDREKNAAIMLTVMATDNGVPKRNSTIDVNVKILDVNDNGPVFKPSYPTIHILENKAVNSPVIQMNATDDDATLVNSKLTYNITSGDRGNFTIDPYTGMVFVKTKLDREKVDSYSMIIMAQDNPNDKSTQKSSTATLSIIIGDINDERPKFTPQVYMAEVLETKTIGAKVLTVLAVDGDKKDTNNSRVAYSLYSLQQTDKTLFSIDKTSGVITVSTGLQDQVGNYTLTVKAMDFGQPRQEGNATVRIRIRDENLHAPVIGNIPHGNTIDVFECVPPNTIFHSFNYTDADSDPENKMADFNMSALGDNVIKTFTILKNGSLKTTDKLDAQRQGKYTLQVHATDRGTPPRQAKPVTITIRVKDVNDHLPSFPNTFVTATVKENTTDTFVTKVLAEDVDSNSIACYSIQPGQVVNGINISDVFNITEATGEVFVTEAIDYEQTTEIKFVVSVEDCSAIIDTRNMCSNDTKFADVNPNVTVTVSVEDIDDNPPVFINKAISLGMRRTMEPGTVLKLQLKNSMYVDDRDSPANGNLTWEFSNNGQIITSDNLNGFDTTSGVEMCRDKVKHIFCIDGNGTITNNKFFSEDRFGYFKVPVRVSDKAGNSSAMIQIYLIGDSQILMMTVLNSKEHVSSEKDDILQEYGRVTGLKFVYDGIEDHKEGAVVDDTRSDLYFHVVDKDNTVLSAEEAERVVDKNVGRLTQVMRDHGIQRVQSSQTVASETSNTSLKFYVAIAVAVVLGVAFILVAYAGVVTKNKYQRKLKAATIKSVDTTREMVDGNMAVPGSNQYSKQANPLLNAKVEKPEDHYDDISLSSNNSIDVNEVDDPRNETVYDKMEEREVTLDMFTEDTFVRSPDEDPLAAALRIHELQKSRETLVDSDPGSDGEPQDLRFQNHAYQMDDMESTEI